MLLAAAILCGGFFVSPASAQWASADLFPGQSSTAKGKGKSQAPNRLEGEADTAPVLRGLGRLGLNLPGGGRVELQRNGFERRRDGDVTWRGAIRGEEDSRVILTVKNGHMAGWIQRGIDEYKILPGPGRSHVIERVNPNARPFEEYAVPPVDYSTADTAPTLWPSGSPMTPYGNSPNDIQLMVLYTPQSRVSAGGTSQMEVLIQSKVDQVNASFADSGMTARISLIRTEEIDYAESGFIGADLQWMFSSDGSSGDMNVLIKREFFAADVVSLIVDYGADCYGAAYVMNQVNHDFWMFAYNVTSLACDGTTLAHEIGHNMGFEHNPEDSQRLAYGQPTATPFSFGHYVDGGFRTIMSYPTQCPSGCPTLRQFSNPNLNFLGVPTGIVDARDNAQTGEYTAPIVADFMNAFMGAIVNRRVAVATDDVEELADGSVVLDSTTLELGDGGISGVQAVGLRFQNIHIPPGMRIDSAYLEFEAANLGSGATTVTISAEAADNAAAFSATPFDVTGRAATLASVQWDIPAWTATTEKHYSPEIKAVIQEVTDRAGWLENNSLVITLSGTGVRTALSHDGGAVSAPLLHVEYSDPSRPETTGGPTAAFSYTCLGLTCNFTDESTDAGGSVVSWYWNFGDGNVSFEQNPTVIYAAEGSYNVSLEVSNDQGWLGYVGQTITVVAGNTSPVATDNSYTTAVDTPVSGNVLTDGTPDSDVNGDALTVTANTSPANGTVTVAVGGAFTYTPNTGYAGADSFTYTISDGNGGTATATVGVTVSPTPNTAPVATDNAYTTAEDVAVSGNVLTDGTPDSDADGDALTVTANTSPLNGVVTVAATGAFTYTPNANFNGPDSFTYTVSDGNGGTATATVAITVNAVADAPVATDNSYVTDEDVAFSGNVLTDGTPDSDGDGDILTVTANTNPLNGALTMAATGAFTYTPAAEYSGSDSFTYTVSDGTGLSATATVSITVNWVNDPPVATDNAYITDKDVAVTGNLMTDGVPDSDIEGDVISVSTTLPVRPAGMVSIAINTGVFTYTPSPGYVGTDSFQYTVTDGNSVSAPATVTITVNPVNDPPVAAFNYSCAKFDCVFTDASTDVDGTISSWSWSFDDGTTSTLQNPTHSFAAAGTYTVALTVTDNEGATDTVSQSVAVVNAAPVATDNAYSTAEDASVSGNVLTDGTPDSDADGDVLTVTANTSPTNGTVTVAASGAFTYTPNADFNGSDGFTYTVGDGTGGSATAAISITVTPVNDAPVAYDNSYITGEDIQRTGNVLTDGTPDSDVDGDVLTVIGNTNPLNGTLAISADGAFVYIPAAEYSGGDSFTYTVSDGAGGSATATVNITVNPLNDPPTATEDIYFTAEDTPISGNVLTDGTPDSDIEGDPLSVTSFTVPVYGGVTIASNGAFTYTPAQNFVGAESFTYMVSDGNGGSATATVWVNVSAVNDAPVATANVYTVAEDAAISGNLLTDGTPDSDVDGDPLTVTANTNPANGTVSVAANGAFTYTPATNFNGSDSFTYTVSDGLLTATATVSLAITPVNDAPLASFGYSCTGFDCAFTDGSSDVEGAIAAWSWSFGDGGVSTVQNPAHSYTADGTYTVSLTVTDSGGVTATASQAIAVSNAAPVATANAYTTDEDTALSGNVLTDGTPDSDADGNPLTASLATGPASGTVTVAADGTFTYTPAANFNGTDSFTYAVSDGVVQSTATVTLTVNSVPDAPVATDNSYVTVMNSRVIGNFLTDGVADSDPDGDPLTLVAKTVPVNGRVRIYPDGSFNYKPNIGFTGTDSFTYTIDDGTGRTAIGRVTITVQPLS